MVRDKIDENAHLQYRNQYIHILRDMETTGTAVQKRETECCLQFISERPETPKYVCICCVGIFFHFSVLKANEEEIQHLTSYDSVYICQTCHDQFRKKNFLTISVRNDLEFPKDPECIKELTSLEERLVSPIVPFMQIPELQRSALNPQLGIKGSVVNIPVEIPEMIQTLPRTVDRLQTIQLKFKRRLNHASTYIKQSVNRAKVCTVLAYLIGKSLYEKYDTRLDEEFIQKNRDNTTPLEIPDEDSGEEYDIGTRHVDQANKKKAQHTSLNDFDFGDDDDVMLMDMNEETAKNIVIYIAPGQ